MADIKQETVCFIEEAESEEPLVSTNEKSVFSSQSQSCLNFESFTEKTQKKNSRENVKGILTNDELEKFEGIFWRSANQTELRIDNSKIRPFLLVGETSQGLIKGKKGPFIFFRRPFEKIVNPDPIIIDNSYCSNP